MQDTICNKCKCIIEKENKAYCKDCVNTVFENQKSEIKRLNEMIEEMEITISCLRDIGINEKNSHLRTQLEKHKQTMMKFK